MRMELLNWQELKKHSTKEKEKLTVYIKNGLRASRNIQDL